jgi:hypothetical protein
MPDDSPPASTQDQRRDRRATGPTLQHLPTGEDPSVLWTPEQRRQRLGPANPELRRTDLS